MASKLAAIKYPTLIESGKQKRQMKTTFSFFEKNWVSIVKLFKYTMISFQADRRPLSLIGKPQSDNYGYQ